MNGFQTAASKNLSASDSLSTGIAYKVNHFKFVHLIFPFFFSPYTFPLLQYMFSLPHTLLMILQGFLTYNIKVKTSLVGVALLLVQPIFFITNA